MCNIILFLTILLLVLFYCYFLCLDINNLNQEEQFQDFKAKLRKAKDDKTSRNKQDVDLANKKQLAELNILDTEKKTKDNILLLNSNISLIKKLIEDLDRNLADSATNIDAIINLNRSINSVSKTIVELANTIPNNATYKADHEKGQSFMVTELPTILTKSLESEQKAYTNIIQEYNNLVSTIESLRSSIDNYIVDGDINQVTNAKNQLEKSLFRLPIVAIKIPNIPSYETTYKASQIYITDKLPLYLSDLSNYISRTQPNIQKYNAKQEQIKREKEMLEYQRNNPRPVYAQAQAQAQQNSSNNDYEAWLQQDILNRREQAQQASIDRAQSMGNRGVTYADPASSFSNYSLPPEQIQVQISKAPTKTNQIRDAQSKLRSILGW